MHPYLNSAIMLLLHDERLREAERHRRLPTVPGQSWWRRWRDDRRPRRGDHDLAA
jgi:hypothetical protein